MYVERIVFIGLPVLVAGVLIIGVVKLNKRTDAMKRSRWLAGRGHHHQMNGDLQRALELYDSAPQPKVSSERWAPIQLRDGFVWTQFRGEDPSEVFTLHKGRRKKFAFPEFIIQKTLAW